MTWLKSFWRGILAAFAFSPPDSPPARTDAEAIAEDWRRVGEDMEAAIRKFEEERAREIVRAGGVSGKTD